MEEQQKPGEGAIAPADQSKSAEGTAQYLSLRKLQRREWGMWACSLAVILFLTAGVSSLSLPAIIEGRNTPTGAGALQAVGGLVFLIVLFCAYLTYEKVLINRLRLEIAERQMHSTVWRDLALVDQLTGLYNRRFAERRLREEISRAHRRGFALTLVLFDLDRFKQTNDQFGHAAGDAMLRAFADNRTKVTRAADLAARLGGDEFMLLLTECDASQVPMMLARLHGIEMQWLDHKIPIVFSAGWKQYEKGESPQQMMQVADKALYENKNSRRNMPAETRTA